MHPLSLALLDVIAGRPPRWEGDGEVLMRELESRGLAALAVADARERESAGEAPGLPDTALAGHAAAYHAAALHTTLVLEATERALSGLRAVGIETLVFKGVALVAGGLYTDPGARPVEDVDLLVRAEDVAGAVEALGRAGFEPWSAWDPSRMTWLSSFTLSDARAPEGVSPALDLHWATPYAELRLAGPWREDPLWDCASDGLPAPEPHFVVLAEHLLKHLRVLAHLRGLGDLARLAPSLVDAPLLVHQARRRGSLPGLRAVLALLREHLDVELDEAVVSAVDVPRGLEGRAARYLEPDRLLGVRPGERSGSSRIGGIFGPWTIIDSPMDSAGKLVRVLAPSAAWLRARYPDERPLRRRSRYVRDLTRWARGRGSSPLSPNQEHSR